LARLRGLSHLEPDDRRHERGDGLYAAGRTAVHRPQHSFRCLVPGLRPKDACVMSTSQSPMSWREYLSSDTITSSRQATAQRVYWGVLSFFANPLAVFGLAIIVVLSVMAIFAPWVATHNPLTQNLSGALQPPSAQNWFGTDEYGRDIYSRIVYGSRISLYIV